MAEKEAPSLFAPQHIYSGPEVWNRSCNVDMLKLIQLGLTFCDESGNLPRCNGELSVWQFNFRWVLHHSLWFYSPEVAAEL